MNYPASPPSFHFQSGASSLRDMAQVVGMVPDSILHEPAVQLPYPGAPLVVSDPALAREVLNDREGRFTRDKIVRRLFRRAWGDGLAAAEGESWQNQRRAASPAFTPSAVEQRLAAFASAAGKAAQEWQTDVPMELTRLVARIIAQIVFSTLVDGRGEVDTASVAADMPAYIRRIATFGLRDILPMPEAWHDHMRGIPGDPVVQRMKALAQYLSERGQRGDDMASLLDGIGPVADNILGLLPAAMDTTVSGTSWALYMLAAHPEWQAQVAEEARACAGDFRLDRLSVTRRVVQEVLRLYPPAPMLMRTAAHCGELGGYPLRKGQPVAIFLYAMHRHHQHWQNPAKFDPDRFLPERGNQPAWMPFGYGPRVCIASQFALAEITVVVARMLAELELAPAGSEPEVTLQVTTRSACGLNVTARARG
jgi:cytochrome P450